MTRILTPIVIDAVTEPANPPAGYVHIYPDSANDDKLKVKHSDGGIANLEDAGIVDNGTGTATGTNVVY